jgi:hypothetical protein
VKPTTNINMKTIITLLSLLILAISTPNASSQTFDKPYYRLTTEWLGKRKSLDVPNEGQNNHVRMAKSESLQGQSWKITPIGDTGYFRLTTEWLGQKKSLDVVNDGKNNKVQLAKTDDVEGQYWKITPLGNGHYRLTTKWLGETRCLDVVNDGKNDKLELTDSANDTTGQAWKFTPFE